MDPHFDGVIFKTHVAEVRRRLSRPFPPFYLVDARPQAAYELGHIPGAVSVSAADLESGLPSGAAEKAEFIVVGNMAEDPDMRAASLALRRHGAHRVVELTTGMADWTRSGYPIEKGSGAAPGAAPKAA
ncbi:MAG TPA: rhodanese-like domain-containing protein [Thermoanaerobaculia bacterium]|jgi:rhodanese-related sulfurtransferase|nr:rhodanese-like domain-containing protein [Thermoanaerobaculia bacterium]